MRLILLCTLLLFACKQKDDFLTLTGQTMGTTYSIKIEIEDQMISTTQLQQEIDQELSLINKIYSTYDSDSELSKINQSKSLSPQKVSTELFFLLTLAKDISKKTNGAFDITVGPLVNLYGFGPMKKREELPKSSEINHELKKVGMDKFTLNEKELTITKKIPDLYLDLSAIAKGRGVDLISKLLGKKALINHIVEIGGEVKAMGWKNSAKNITWGIALEDPSLSGTPTKIFPLRNLSVATSGNYRNFHKINNKNYSHIIDPITGKTIDNNLASVTVIHPECAIADGYATAFMVLGKEKSLKVAKKEKLPIILIEYSPTNNKFITHEAL